jgi:glycerol-3-phosphate dehydrogenase (NAD(P)+)
MGSPSIPRHFGVIGAGAWGTALAVLLAGNGHRVTLWGNDPDHLRELARSRRNARYLPGIPFPEGLTPVPHAADLFAAADTLLVVVPSVAFRGVLQMIRAQARPGYAVCWATKGLDPGSARPLHAVASEILGDGTRSAVISGPTFAIEVARGLPTAVTVASADTEFARDLAGCLHNDRFRVYVSRDVVGVGIGGSLKNVYAIAAGISDGLGFGANSRAALITRGLAEITRLGIAAGGLQETFMGLAGLGDLLLTCTDNQSRNRRFGLALAEGRSVQQARAAIDQVVEGIDTAREAGGLAASLAVDMPICAAVSQVIFADLGPEQAVELLLSRRDGLDES